MSVIIVEGPDGAGKTTLINSLIERERSGGRAVFWTHHGAYLGQSKISGHYLRSMYGHYTQPKTLRILDRSWIAEPIYGTVMRGGATRIAPWERRILARVAFGAGAVVVLCLPPFDVCERHWKSRLEKEYPKKAEQLDALYCGYLNWVRTPEAADGPRILNYDWTAQSLGHLCERIDDALHQARNDGPGIGARAATTLLIGDRAEPRAEGRTKLPFCSLLKIGCSAWLSTRLEEWQVPERSLYWVNQHGLELDQFAPGSFARFKRVVALGDNAVKWCAKRSIVCAPIPHPQYWKRFHSKEPYRLKEMFA